MCNILKLPNFSIVITILDHDKTNISCHGTFKAISQLDIYSQVVLGRWIEISLNSLVMLWMHRNQRVPYFILQNGLLKKICQILHFFAWKGKLFYAVYKSS